MKKNYYLIVIATLVMAFNFTSCKKDSTPAPETISMSQIKVLVEGQPYTFSMEQANKKALITLSEGFIMPAQVKVESVTLSSNAKGVAVGDMLDVSEEGKITINIESKDGKITESYELTIIANPFRGSSLSDLVVMLNDVEYRADFTASTASVSIPKNIAVPAKIKVKSFTLSPGATTADIVANQDVTLLAGVFSVTVKGQDNIAQTQYTITIVADLPVDASGNVYKPIKVGTQTWLSTNLKTTKYNDGTEIEFLQPGIPFTEGAAPEYAFSPDPQGEYLNDGNLYTFAVTINTKGVCPEGYRVPTLAEGDALVAYANSVRGTSTMLQALWTKRITAKPDSGEGSPLKDAAKNNASGFDAVPLGFRNSDGSYSGGHTNHMTFHFNNSGVPAPFFVYAETEADQTGNPIKDWNAMNQGYAVRCIKGN